MQIVFSFCADSLVLLRERIFYVIFVLYLVKVFAE